MILLNCLDVYPIFNDVENVKQWYHFILCKHMSSILQSIKYVAVIDHYLIEYIISL